LIFALPASIDQRQEELLLPPPQSELHLETAAEEVLGDCRPEREDLVPTGDPLT
jgi:hypothetical protein